VAPLEVPLVFFLKAVALSHAPFRDAINSIIMLPYAYAAEIVFGLPAWTIFKIFNLRSLYAYAATGALIGWIVALVLGLLDEVVPCIFAALCSALLFRYISISN
jgi:hypothetical protein